MDKCWAKSLGNCSNKRSREHLVSKSLFSSKTVHVQGFDWCKEEKEVGLAGLTSKILCTRHNSELSPLDSEASRFMDSLQYGLEVTQRRRKMKPKRWSIHRKSVDGYLVERWFLKTLVNVSLESMDTAAIPHKQIVEMIYGITQIPSNLGLHSFAEMGDSSTLSRALSFKPLWKHGMLAAGVFEFSGFGFVIALDDVGSSFAHKTYQLHHKHYSLVAGKHVSFRMTLKW